nr:bifunctional 4-hydroxy-2-oxoglutarate aldolase/2-dehydro-3-deoxy-phosphogluconate aldolase [Kineosporia babensis]
MTRRRVIGIFRGQSPERTVELCHRAWDSGVELVEVPVQSPAAVPSLRAAVEAAQERGALVGAGTVLRLDQLEEVLAFGASFVVCPGLHEEVVTECLRRGVPILPGVATSTEVAKALSYGLNWLKAFPAEQLTPGWIRAQLGPFPDVRFVATGGISAANASDFLAAGCRAVAIGSAFGSESGIQALERVL